MRSHYYGSNWAGKIGWGISLVVMVLATTTFYHRHKHEELGIGYQQGEILSPKGYVGFCREAVEDEQRRFTELVEKMNEPDYEAKSGEIEEILIINLSFISGMMKAENWTPSSEMSIPAERILIISSFCCRDLILTLSLRNKR